MNEQIQTIIDRARELLAAATPGPVTVYPHPRPGECCDESRVQWGDLVTTGRSMWTMIPMADAEALAFAVNNIGTLCDATVDAERRAKEAEAQAAAMQLRVQEIAGDFNPGHERENGLALSEMREALEDVAANHPAGRALLDRLHAAEAKVAALRDRAGIAEGREVCAKANAAEMAGRLDAQNAGLVRMARDRDAALAEVEALKVERDVADRECDRLRAQVDADRQELTRMAEKVARVKARVCAGCMGTGLAGARVNCKSCGGSGVVIVEGVAQPSVMIPDELPRVAPVQGEWKKRPAGTVPWIVHMEAFDTYRKKFGNGQSAERIAERGGFSYREMQCLLAGHYSHECKVDHEPVRGWVGKLA